MEYSKEQIMKMISEETNKDWDGGAAVDAITFVKNQIEAVGAPLNQAQLDALTSSLTYLLKASAKNALVGGINLLLQMGAISSTDQK